jgi:hypothetical protein
MRKRIISHWKLFPFKEKSEFGSIWDRNHVYLRNFGKKRLYYTKFGNDWSKSSLYVKTSWNLPVHKMMCCIVTYLVTIVRKQQDYRNWCQVICKSQYTVETLFKLAGFDCLHRDEYFLQRKTSHHASSEITGKRRELSILARDVLILSFSSHFIKTYTVYKLNR